MRTAILLACAVAALLAAAQAAATTTSSADTKGWCKAVIDTNTKAGTMKNKTFVSVATVSPSAWKKVVDAAAANGDRYIALAPSSIKTAVRHQVAWFKHIKANHYSKTTPLTPMTLAEVKQLSNFEKTQCGIKFST